MSERDDPSLEGLRDELIRAAQTGDLAQRTLEVVSIVETAAAPLGIHPVVVGGMAVYFWTASDAFLTHDIDVVMEVSGPLEATLSRLGFERVADGRHWRLPGTEVFLEAPSARLDEDALVTVVELDSGRTAKVLSRVDILLDRLAEFQATGHQVVAQQILVLLAGMTPDEADALAERAPTRRVVAILRTMVELAEAIDVGRPAPASDELHEIAREALRAEYTPKQR